MDYLYTYYDPVPDNDILLLHAKVYVVADFYAIPSLMELAQSKLIAELESSILRDPLQTFVARLSETVDYVYGNTADLEYPSAVDIRGTVVNFIVQHTETVMDHELGPHGGLFTCVESEQFVKDFALAISKKWQKLQKVQCQKCRHNWADTKHPLLGAYCPRCGKRDGYLVL